MRHPPLSAEWIDRPHQRLALGRFVLDSGEAIEDCELIYVVHGKLDADRRNAILVLPAIHSTHHRLDFLIGAGRALDPARWCVICVDALGNGLASSPSNSRRQPLMSFPRFGIRDMVRSQQQLVRAQLGIDRLACVIGASMGGMQALQWGVSFPQAMESIVAMTPMARTSPWSRVVNEAYRRALMTPGPWWNKSGEQVDWQPWVLVQLLAGRTPQSVASEFADGQDIAAWVAQRSRTLATQAPNPVDRVYQTWAYDAHDVGRADGFSGDTAAALASVRARTLVLAPPLDLYNPVDEARFVAAHVPGARLQTIVSDAGHQATTSMRAQDAQFVDRSVREFMELAAIT